LNGGRVCDKIGKIKNLGNDHMQYKALYRTYRPRRFEEVAGQEHIAPVLLRQCESGRLSHAYLFCGPRGTGKTSLALILARAVNCYAPQHGEPCLACESCTAVNHVDIIEIDAASNNGVDEIRELREKVRFTPALGKRKVYVIDEVHMLTTGAFNALLKTLEEPPEHALFILATTEPNKLPATIISRCQRYDFRRIPHAVIVSRVRQVAEHAGLKVQDKAVSAIASNAQGGLRDALSLLDQCAMMQEGGEVTQQDVLRLLGASSVQSVSEVAEYILTSKPGEALYALDAALQGGRDIDVFLRDIAQYLRNMMLCACVQKPGALIELDAQDLSRLQRLSERNGMHSVLRCLHILIAAQNDMKYVSNPRIVLEAALVKAACVQEESDTEALLDRLERLEHKLDALQTNPPSPKPAEKPGEAKETHKEQKKEKPREAMIKPAEKTPAAPDTPKQESEQAGAMWDEILSRLMGEDLGVYSLVCSVKDYVFTENTLRITFSPKDAVFCDSLKQEPNYSALSAVVDGVVGKKLELSMRCDGGQEDARADLGAQVVELLGEDNVKFT
jgi:DNA polymerase-3 subunit gamma/tau